MDTFFAAIEMAGLMVSAIWPAIMIDCSVETLRITRSGVGPDRRIRRSSYASCVMGFVILTLILLTVFHNVTTL